MNVFSFAGVKRNHRAKQGTKDDLTLGLGIHGDGVAHQKCWAPTAPNATCSDWWRRTRGELWYCRGSTEQH